MGRYLALELALILAVVGGSWFSYRAWLKHRQESELTKEAFFSGGPLHDHTEKVAKWTKNYLYTYDRPVLTKANDEGIRESVSNYHNALYEHQGGGVYAYKGSVPLDKLMQYDLEEE